MFIDVDCRHPEAILTPMPEGLSQQQVGLGAGLGEDLFSMYNLASE